MLIFMVNGLVVAALVGTVALALAQILDEIRSV